MLLLDTEPTTTAPSRSRLGIAGWIAAGVVALIAATLAFIHFREKRQETPVARLTILPPEKTSFRFDVQPYGVPALSADGRRLVFGARSEDGNSRLWVRSLDSMTAQPLAGTEGASFFPVLVSRRPLHRVRRGRQAEENRAVWWSRGNAGQCGRSPRRKLEPAGRDPLRTNLQRPVTADSGSGRYRDAGYSARSGAQRDLASLAVVSARRPPFPLCRRRRQRE